MHILGARHVIDMLSHHVILTGCLSWNIFAISPNLDPSLGPMIKCWSKKEGGTKKFSYLQKESNNNKTDLFVQNIMHQPYLQYGLNATHLTSLHNTLPSHPRAIAFSCHLVNRCTTREYKNDVTSQKPCLGFIMPMPYKHTKAEPISNYYVQCHGRKPKRFNKCNLMPTLILQVALKGLLLI